MFGSRVKERERRHECEHAKDERARLDANSCEREQDKCRTRWETFKIDRANVQRANVHFFTGPRSVIFRFTRLELISTLHRHKLCAVILCVGHTVDGLADVPKENNK